MAYMDPATHIVIPDVQSAPADTHRPETPDDHLRWAGQYVADEYVGRPNTSLIVLGDWHDMSSLSWYDRGKTTMEGRRYRADIDKGNADIDVFDAPIRKAERRKAHKLTKVTLLGNHEHRITRAAEAVESAGLTSLDDLAWAGLGYDVRPFTNVVRLDGVNYSHYFYNPMTGRPYAGSNVETRLAKVGASFTMGHQPGLLYGLRNVLGGIQHGLVAGSFYLHDEDYKGPQGNTHWRGIVVCHQVEDGQYDPMFVSADFLCRRYEGKRLREYLKGRK